MKISGFTFAKNTSKLYYPIKESIQSILPIVDEFIVALGDSDADDNTQALIESIGSDKIKFIHTIWDLEQFPNGTENAHQTDIAKAACTGDWLFYLQADEVVHEKYLAPIVARCQARLHDPQVEGFLFKYKHFFGDYDHYNDYHGWYPNEIRIVRNKSDIHSFRSAQSFRRIPDFDGKSYRQKEGTYKLQVEALDAYIYHYGWVRPPAYMQKKSKALDSIHHGKAKAEAEYQQKPTTFDYGNMNLLKTFKTSHPKVMKQFIAQFDWAAELHYEKNYRPQRPALKHETLKCQLLTFIEQHFLGGRHLFTSHNWKIVK